MITARRPTKGFTLIELMVAMVIFTLIMSSVFISFRTAVSSYDLGIITSERGQTERYATTVLTNDLRNAYYLSPSRYNITRRQKENMAMQQEARLLKSTSTRDTESDNSLLDDLPPPIDLNFRAMDNGETDEISFVRRQGMNYNEDRMPWGLERLRYFIQDGALYRSIDDVRGAETDEYGNPIPKEIPPRVEKIGTNVKGIDFKFGYWYDKEWLTATDWDSNSPRYRNPVTEDSEQDKTNEETLPDSQSALLKQQEMEQRVDDMPSWVEITYEFANPAKPDAVTKIRQVVMLPQAQETYVPEEIFQDTSRLQRMKQEGGEKSDARPNDRRPSRPSGGGKSTRQ